MVHGYPSQYFDQGGKKKKIMNIVMAHLSYETVQSGTQGHQLELYMGQSTSCSPADQAFPEAVNT